MSAIGRETGGAWSRRLLHALSRARRRVRSDSGVTLMELLVGMTIMTIFMSMFTASVVMMYRSTSKTQAIADTASQLSIAFNRLDKSVRYASAITQPGLGYDGKSWYVEWLTTYTGAGQCTQLRLNVANGQLQQRTWTVPVNGAGSLSDPTDWLPLASSLESGSGSSPSPFTRLTDSAVPNQQLRLYLIAQTMGQGGTTQSVSDVTFTAFNSSLYSPNDVCAEWSRG